MAKTKHIPECGFIWEDKEGRTRVCTENALYAVAYRNGRDVGRCYAHRHEIADQPEPSGQAVPWRREHE